MSWLYLWFNPCAFYHYPSHTGLRAQSAPGFPCALFKERANEMHSPGENHAAGTRAYVSTVIASEAKQSMAPREKSWITSSLRSSQ
jgi:hypothetical protein